MENDEAVRAGDLACADELDPSRATPSAEDDGAPDIFELEMDGQVHSLPAGLKGAFLRHADYTRKTQELAAHRRALDAERQAVASHAQALGQASADQIELAALDHQLASFHGVDWQAFAAQDAHAARTLWDRFQGMAQARERLANAVAHHAGIRELQAARQAAADMAETGRTLQREIEGWSPDVAAKLVEYAQAFGVTLEELHQAADPRVWKILHRAYQADQAGHRDGAAKGAEQVQAIRPAIVVSGGGAAGGGVRDELGTKEWMKRRNELVRKGR